MNGTLLRAAAALVLLPAVAQAQSTVTVYGRVDAGISKENDGETRLVGGVNTSDRLQMRQNSGSRLGFRGVEDLGGGLKVRFQIEHRLNVDTGASTSSTKTRIPPTRSRIGSDPTIRATARALRASR